MRRELLSKRHLPNFLLCPNACQKRPLFGKTILDSAIPPVGRCRIDRSTFFVATQGTIECVFGFIGLPTAARVAFFRCGVGRLIAVNPQIGRLGGNVLKSGDHAKRDSKKKGAAVQSKDRNMGSALRSIYQKTVEEDVPDEMLALLGKLD